mmetsp:Transcript_3304/g.12372  ORF Transcript_3304/g.12372 Transcript_3304/m.12372 type:complete len:215 (-) Transcript_3304:424-1068(-)
MSTRRRAIGPRGHGVDRLGAQPRAHRAQPLRQRHHLLVPHAHRVANVRYEAVSVSVSARPAPHPLVKREHVVAAVGAAPLATHHHAMEQRLGVVALRRSQPGIPETVAAASVDREPEVTERRSPLAEHEVALGVGFKPGFGSFESARVVVSAGSRGRVVVGTHPGRRALLALQPPRERLVASHLRASRALLGRTRDEALVSARVLSASPALERA